MLHKVIVLLFILVLLIPLLANTNQSQLNIEKYDNETIILAKKIQRWKRIFDHNNWVECGIKYTKDQIRISSLSWSEAIIKAHKNTTYKYRRKEIKIKLNEVLGIIINESRFDRCAIGPNPRKFAYTHKLLEKKKTNYSHTLIELEKVFTHPKFKNRKADVGPGQIVIYKKPWEEVKKYLSLTPGVQKVFDLLARKGRNYRTLNPSSRWPGTLNHVWYTKKVRSYGTTILGLKI